MDNRAFRRFTSHDKDLREFCKRAYDLKGMFMINLVQLADHYHLDDELLAYYIKTAFEFPKDEIEVTRAYFDFDYPDQSDLGNNITFTEVSHDEEGRR